MQTRQWFVDLSHQSGNRQTDKQAVNNMDNVTGVREASEDLLRQAINENALTLGSLERVDMNLRDQLTRQSSAS